MLINCDENDLDRQQANFPSLHPTSSFWHNDPSTFLLHHRSTSELPKTADVVVIGAGVSGAFAALKLSEDESLNVVMLEAREACWGATGRNGGHCQPVLYEHSVDVSTFHLRNFRAIGSLVRKNSISCEWEEMEGGGCHAYYSEPYFEEAKKELMNLQESSPSLASLVHIVSDKAKLAELKIPEAVGALVQTHAAKLSPYKLISWILEHVIRKSDLNLQTSTPVLSICRSDSSPSSVWNVRTPRGTISSAHVLLATNAYTGQLVPKLRSLIVPVRGQMSALVPPKNLLHEPLKHTYSFIGIIGQRRGQNDYLIQRPISSATGDGGQLMFGGGRSLAKNEGVNVFDDDSIDDPVAKYLRTTLEVCMDIDEEKLMTKAFASAPETDAAGLSAEKEWTGVMGFSRDHFPWVGAVPDMPGLWLSAGFTGNGMPNAALSSQHVASLILAASKGKDWRLVEREAVRDGDIPAPYVISTERIERARNMPQVL